MARCSLFLSLLCSTLLAYGSESKTANERFIPGAASFEIHSAKCCVIKRGIGIRPVCIKEKQEIHNWLGKYQPEGHTLVQFFDKDNFFIIGEHRKAPNDESLQSTTKLRLDPTCRPKVTCVEIECSSSSLGRSLIFYNKDKDHLARIPCPKGNIHFICDNVSAYLEIPASILKQFEKQHAQEMAEIQAHREREEAELRARQRKEAHAQAEKDAMAQAAIVCAQPLTMKKSLGAKLRALLAHAQRKE